MTICIQTCVCVLNGVVIRKHPNVAYIKFNEIDCEKFLFSKGIKIFSTSNEPGKGKH